MIEKIYYGEIENIKTDFENKEYKNISKKIKKIETQILENVNYENRGNIEKYLESINERGSIEAKQQFKNGFKTAIKLIN